jgi:PilZ domain
MKSRTIEPDIPRPSALNRFRRDPRVRVAAPFVCALSPLRPKRWLRRPKIDLGVVYDLSVRGVRVSTEAAIKPGEEITLSLRLPKQIAWAEIAVATVQWSKDSFYGLAFRKLSSGSQSRLRKYLASASRVPFLPGSRRH